MLHDSSIDQKRLKWQCRRGILEVEICLQRLLENQYLYFTEAEKKDFSGLLNKSDTVLLNWLIYKKLPDTSDPLFEFVQKISQLPPLD